MNISKIGALPNNLASFGKKGDMARKPSDYELRLQADELREKIDNCAWLYSDVPNGVLDRIADKEESQSLDQFSAGGGTFKNGKAYLPYTGMLFTEGKDGSYKVMQYINGNILNAYNFDPSNPDNSSRKEYTMNSKTIWKGPLTYKNEIPKHSNIVRTQFGDDIYYQGDTAYGTRTMTKHPDGTYETAHYKTKS